MVILASDRQCRRCSETGFAGAHPCETCRRPASLLTASPVDHYRDGVPLPASHRDGRHLCCECAEDEALAFIAARAA